jgi:hypothetical protein
MKMFMLVYNEALDEAVIGVFKRLGIHGYTKWKGAYGEGTETGPKLGTHVWPGRNYVLAAVVENEEVPLLAEAIKGLKAEHPKGGIRAFRLQVEETI